MEPVTTNTAAPAATTATPKKENNSLALASVILGGLGFIFGIFTAVPAVICGHMALSELKRVPDKYDPSSKGMSIAGLITGYVIIGMTVVFGLIIMLVFVIAANA